MKQETNTPTSAIKPGMTAPQLADGLCAAWKWHCWLIVLEKRGGCHD